MKRNERPTAPLTDDEKKFWHERLDEVLSQTHGIQVIILSDNDKLSDLYQNTCVPCLIGEVSRSAIEYALMCDIPELSTLICPDEEQGVIKFAESKGGA
jgi:hypothetical protein